MDLVSIARYLPARLLVDDERGASLVEYAFLVGLIAIVCLVAILFLGSSTSSKYSNVGSQLKVAGS
jgi:Flp pilus assembly pilin Flp